MNLSSFNPMHFEFYIVFSLQNFTAGDRIRGTLTDEEEELNDTDLASGNKDTFVLEVKYSTV